MPAVALVSHEYPPYYFGGIGSYTYDLSRFLSRKNVPTTVFCGRSRKLVEEQVDGYLKVVRLPFFDIPSRAYWFQLQNHSLLRKRLREFDVVHAANSQSSAVCAFVKPANSAMVTTIHGIPRFNAKAFFNTSPTGWELRDFMFNFMEMPVDEMMYRILFRRSKKIVAVGHNVLREAKIAFHRLPIEKITVIPNGIDFQKIDALKRVLNESPEVERGYILYYGRLVAVKGILYLLSAVAELKNRFPNIRLRIVGKGPLLSQVREMIRDLDLSAHVDFLGYLPSHDDLMLAIMKCSMVVLPSSFEGNSVAVLEAMACGKPVVAFDYPFAAEVIEDFRTGLLAKRGDSMDLAQKIELLLNDEGLRNRLGANAFERAYLNYNWDRLVDRYIELYKEATGS